ncbi:non-homologous end-joining DNA ligase [Streptomyces evansiae]|uniref:non-homologous end-joining DNA ligase n=1 Tax=Streptomyces evansiae TaxID=3075535 RepID=UPI0028860F23|nr:non-homologous end-joining DNA ligase [Streptomyces sp. DSM 41859]MDT0424625.1 non-homologous end-joining DNA ligase [Streptomyces sp. DSM 41859]
MTPITHVAGRRLALSNLEKVLYPGDGFTKGEVLHYYAGVAEVMLPHLRDRPVSFLRYPDGPSGQRFFSKNPPPGTPEWVRVARVERSDGAGEQVVIDDLPSLMWAANLVTEFHTPQWRLDAQGRADRLVLDLDPGEPATIVECGVVARWLRDRLAADGLTAYVKTSGSKGLHLLAPLVPAPSSEVTAYAKRLAVEAERELPDLALHRMTKKLRAGKVFVDFSQNAAAKTTATPYTLRARDYPTVSAPLTWAEVEHCEAPEDLVVLAQDVPSRLKKHGELLAPLVTGEDAGELP